MTAKQMLEQGMTSAEIINQSKTELAEHREKLDAKQSKVSEIAKLLGIELAKAESMINQELARKAASERYRKSEAYKLRLEQQKLVRKMLKEAK